MIAYILVTFFWIVLLTVAVAFFSELGYPLWFLIILLPIMLLVMKRLLGIGEILFGELSHQLKQLSLRSWGVETEGLIVESTEIPDPYDDECFFFQGKCRYTIVGGKVMECYFESPVFNAHHINYAHSGDLWDAEQIDYSWANVKASFSANTLVMVVYLPWLPMVRSLEIPRPAWYESLQNIDEVGAYRVLLFAWNVQRLQIRSR